MDNVKKCTCGAILEPKDSDVKKAYARCENCKMSRRTALKDKKRHHLTGMVPSGGGHKDSQRGQIVRASAAVKDNFFSR